MADPLLAHVVVPIGTEDDATATCDALEPFIDEEITKITVVHVIERTEGYPDKAPFEARKNVAERIFRIVADRFQDRIDIESELRYGTDPVEEIFATAESVDATAIGFTHQPDSRLKRFLSRTDPYQFVTENEQPVIAFSRVESSDSNDTAT
ncbi:universal stress protein [Halostagnicola sp. A-GB9-2]|uniref:universal stress protein n=1 Tax=Halostagnicola sp. A-GB9-2 TaxID=3048066 RepID=UPI0024C04E56|nr:universal stress protein [Halostagnicola sp. A-GB9-2]MDJ1430918.1 universal stress protein [Halostagnicola sp. A-GB9-2]